MFSNKLDAVTGPIADLFTDMAVRSNITVSYHEAEVLLFDILKFHDLTPKTCSAGANRVAALFKDTVLKIPFDTYGIETIEDDVQFIRKMRRNSKWARYFPATRLVCGKFGKAIVQERVSTYLPLAAMRKLNVYEHSIHEYVQRLAMKLGIDDVHEENYGWKFGPTGPYPVFFDCEFTEGSGNYAPARSWMVA